MINNQSESGNGVPHRISVTQQNTKDSTNYLQNQQQNQQQQKNVTHLSKNQKHQIMSTSITGTSSSSSNIGGNNTNSIHINEPITNNGPPTTNSMINSHRPRSGSTREQLFHAVEYYNSNVLKARLGAGLSGSSRSSVNERHLINNRPNNNNNNNGHLISQPQNITTSTTQNYRTYLNPDHLYRSNSSLELLHDQNSVNSLNGSHHIDSLNLTTGGGNLRREYGSHGSIDIISTPTGTPSESFFAMLQDYRPAVLGVIGTDQRSPGPSEFLKGKLLHQSINNSTSGNVINGDLNGGNVVHHQNSINNQIDDSHHFERPASPKLKNKLHRLWGQSNNNNTSTNNSGSNKNNTRQQQNISVVEDFSILSNTSSNSINISSLSSSSSSTSTATNSTITSNNMHHSVLLSTTHSASTSSADIEERQRRRAFAHFDCQSLTANLGYAAKLRGLLLARRRNTTTGASAASMMSSRSATPDAADSSDEDFGDGQYNELLENCPYFRNEIGGEEEREVSLTRMQTNKPSRGGQHRQPAIHRPTLACGVSIVECPPDETLWRQQTCPFQKGIRPIESVDHGARYYRQYFNDQEHQNWFGMDEQLGPVAISIKREKLPDSITESNTTSNRYQFRMIVRTSELLTLRGSVIEDSIPNPRGSGKPVTTKEVLEYVAPEVQLNCLRLGVSSSQCEQQLIKLDEQGLTNKYKVGILYCRAGQSSEEDMYNNEEAGPAFMEFLETIGKRVRLKGFDHYKAGLDNKTDSTGTHSLYATHQDCEIMFHVSTMLPFTPNNRQQLLRKRHIGNDIVTIVFQEPGALPFTPKNIRSQFQHVFIIVRVVNPCTENTTYRIGVSRSKEVPVFGPPIPASMFTRTKSFAEFLLAKVINAENAAHRSEKFATMATRTRQEYLKDLATNYCTTTGVDPGSKFSIFPSKKKEKPKIRFSGDALQRGAFCWQVVLQDSGLSSAVDCFLGISVETFVLIEECSRQLVFVTPTKSILGWSTCGNSLRIYHHQGECVTINMRDCGERDEQLEVIERLRSVTIGCGALELNLRRNPMGQLGFHVQPDGVVTQVETSGQAWVAGLRQGYRLVEICKIAVATLSHDQMVDLLKTSAQVTVTVIESFGDYSPRRGCFLQNCKFNIINFDGDFDASTTQSSGNMSNNGGGGGSGVNSEHNSPSKNVLKKSASAQLQQGSGNHRRRYERNFSPPRSSNSSGYGTGSSSRSFSIPNEHVRPIPDMGTLTSSSSGHSSNDDRWYDILENVVENQQQQSSSQTPPIPDQHNQQHHQKLISTNSLPLGGPNNPNMRPLSIHDPTKLSTLVNSNNNGSNDHNRPAPRMANVEYLITKPPTANNHQPHHSQHQQQQHHNQQSTKFHNDQAEILIKHLTIIDSNNGIDSTSINNEPIYNSKSISTTDDEMHNMDISPRLRRSATTTNITKLRNGNLSSSSASSSRNNSPRPHSEAQSSSSNSSVITTNSNNSTTAAKLRPGVTNRNQTHLLQRNSVNYTSSSLQEDLMKLINPDYLSSDDSVLTNNAIRCSINNLQKQQITIPNSHSLGNISQISGNLKTIMAPIASNEDFLLKNKSRSREAINFGNQPVPELKQQQQQQQNGNEICNNENNINGEKKEQVIFTTARPANVISQTINNNNSKINNQNSNLEFLKPVEENILHISENGIMTPNYRKGLNNNNNRKKYEHNVVSQPLPLLPDPNDMDWSSLVDTATRAMMLQFQEEQRKNVAVLEKSQQQQVLQQDIIEGIISNGSSSLNDTNLQYQQHENNTITGENSSSSSCGSAVPEIQNHLSQLEDRILRETRRRKSLEHAVRRLTEENRRLQDESQAAVQQLRRFTEWFFQTIDRQS